jgi:WD40 repeat protein
MSSSKVSACIHQANAKIYCLTGSEPRILEGHTGIITCVVVCPFTSHVLTGSVDTTVRVWDVETGDEVRHRFTGNALQ